MSESDEVGEHARQILDLSQDPGCRARAHTLTQGARWAGFGGISVIVFSVLFGLAAVLAPNSR